MGMEIRSGWRPKGINPRREVSKRKRISLAVLNALNSIREIIVYPKTLNSSQQSEQQVHTRIRNFLPKRQLI